MLAIVLKILSILGIVLLTLVCVALAVLLLVLFFPVSYRLKGQKDAEEMTLHARASWLFGFLRVQFVFPEPGEPVIKILCFRLKGKKSKEDGQERKETSSEAAQVAHPETAQKTATEAVSDAGSTETAQEVATEAISDDRSTEITPEVATEASSDAGSTETAQEVATEAVSDAESTETAPETATESGSETLFERISAKYDKIKYTIKKICDRIKHIWENITFYKELLTEENTRELFGHACFRLGKVLKSIRPRKLKADIRFGAASPDVTGYLYGVYSMLSPKLGKNICVVPDFDRAVLEGEFYAAGHITVFKILVNGILLLLDKRLRKFRRRLKRHGAAQQ